MRRPIAARALALVLALALHGHALAAAGSDTVYARTLLLRADARCRLFTPDIAAALSAAASQARGAALRAGTPSAAVDGAQTRARAKADGTDCRSKDLAIAAARVRQAFAGYAQLSAMSFPGGYADWRAVRRRPDPAHPSRPQWSLVQFSPAGTRPTLVGLRAEGRGVAPQLSVANAAPDALAASSARLVLRDPAKAAVPYVDARRRALSAQLPPRPLDRIILAQSKSVAPASLLPSQTPHGVLFQFPPAAVEALAALDPREAVAVEFVYPSASGERIATAWIEAGDFAAARAFLAVRR